MSWTALKHHRSLLRLRCGYIMLGHVDGHASQRMFQTCVCCGAVHADLVRHVCLECPAFATDRAAVDALQGGMQYPSCLIISPGDPAFEATLGMASNIEVQVQRYWTAK